MQNLFILHLLVRSKCICTKPATKHNAGRYIVIYIEPTWKRFANIQFIANSISTKLLELASVTNWIGTLVYYLLCEKNKSALHALCSVEEHYIVVHLTVKWTYHKFYTNTCTSTHTLTFKLRWKMQYCVRTENTVNISAVGKYCR
jgi:hypothetical protein